MDDGFGIDSTGGRVGTGQGSRLESTLWGTHSVLLCPSWSWWGWGVTLRWMYMHASPVARCGQETHVTHVMPHTCDVGRMYQIWVRIHVRASPIYVCRRMHNMS